MKSAILIMNGKQQVILTPEDELEMAALKRISDCIAKSKNGPTTYWGSFYDCEGGWSRLTERRLDRSKGQFNYTTARAYEQDDSLILVLDSDNKEVVENDRDKD